MAKVSSRRFAAFLRGINVGGHRSVPMKRLVPIAAALGWQDIATYIQSGNVVFSAREPADRNGEALAAAIEREFGFSVPVVVRDASAMAAIAARHPFEGRGADPKFLHVGFLAGRPKQSAAIDPARSPADRTLLRGTELYVYFGKGAGPSKLTADYVDRALGTVVTFRNWNTVQKMNALVAAA